MEKTIKISNGKEYTVGEVKYKAMIEANAAGKAEEASKFLLINSTGMTEEEFADLSMKDGLTLQKAVNEVNGLNEDFLQTAPKE